MTRPPRVMTPEERALWARVIATVTPLKKDRTGNRRLSAAAAQDNPPPPRGGGSTGLVPGLTEGEDARTSVGSPPPPSPSAPPPPGGGGSKRRTPIGSGFPRESQNSKPKPRPAPPAVDTLDASWDRRLSRGLVSPESTVDLHGHTLATAHARLDQGLAAAIARQDRVLLLITGKPPRPESERPHARGAIRAAVGDWLAASRHADRIAAVRNAHPRHGGAGALYIVLKRQRSPGARNS